MCCAIVESSFDDWDDVIQTQATARTNSVTGEMLVRWVENDGVGAPSWRDSVTVLTEAEAHDLIEGPEAAEGW